MRKLFVYGTLRLGSDNEYAQLLARTTRHLGEATMAGRLYRVAHYPGLTASESEEDRVIGDLFDGVDDELLEKLDDYEGEEYVRELKDVDLGGEILQTLVYRYVLPTDGLLRIRSGDWNHPDRIPN